MFKMTSKLEIPRLQKLARAGVVIKPAVARVIMRAMRQCPIQNIRSRVTFNGEPQQENTKWWRNYKKDEFGRYRPPLHYTGAHFMTPSRYIFKITKNRFLLGLDKDQKTVLLELIEGGYDSHLGWNEKAVADIRKVFETVVADAARGK